MTEMPRPDGHINGAGNGAHRRHADDRRVMGRFVGSAIHALRLASATDDPTSALNSEVYEMGLLIGHGLIDCSVAGDLVREAALTRGLVLRLGEDATGFSDEHAARDDRAVKGEREAVARAADFVECLTVE